MFLKCRATQAEYFDSPDRPQTEIHEFHTALERVNRLFSFAGPFQRLIPQCLGEQACRDLRILDLGAGDGSLGVSLAQWARTQGGWNWRVTNMDISLPALRLSKTGGILGSALALPFRDTSFDLVIASQMSHHLSSNEDVKRHLREAWRVAKRGFLLSDLHRGPVLYALLWLLFRLRRFPAHFQADALLSVRRGFRLEELQALADEAGMIGARVSLYQGTRVTLTALKS